MADQEQEDFERLRRQKDLEHLESLAPEDVPERPQTAEEREPEGPPQVFTAEDGTRVEVREVADLPDEMDERRITHEILEELRDLHAFLRERMGEDA